MAASLTRKRAATPYHDHRDYVLAVLRRRCGWLEHDEREETFHEAYAVLLEKERDGALDLGQMPMQQVRAYLTQTAIHKALDEGKRAGRKRSVELDDFALNTPDDARAPDDLAAAAMDSARVREIVAELPARRQAIVKLRFFFDRTPGEIQRLLGITERAYRRELERAMRHLVERYESVREGSFCDSRRSVILAYIAGIAGPSRMAVAQEHLATCPSCASWAAQLRDLSREAAAVIPLPVLTFGSGRGERWLQSVVELRELVFGAGSSAKQHAVGIATRVDPGAAGYLSAARPGTVAAAIAGCIAIGSGATYCVIEQFPAPLLGGSDRAATAKAAERKPRREGPAPEPARATPVATASPVATPSPRPATPRPRRQRLKSKPQPEPEPAAVQQPTVASSQEAAEQEFGFEGGAPATSTGSSTSTSAPVQTSPPPAPPGEFDP